MIIAVGSDHRGFLLKEKISILLKELNCEVVDCGPENSESVDYPEFASKVAKAVSEGTAERGILICGTGIGMCIVANKYPQVRATVCHDDLTARMSRLHNDANVLCLSGDLLGERSLDRMIQIWVETEFEEGRHARRVNRIREIEKENGL